MKKILNRRAAMGLKVMDRIEDPVIMVIEENRRKIMLKKAHVMEQEMEPMVEVIVVIFEDLILVMAAKLLVKCMSEIMAVMDLMVKLIMVAMDIEDLLVAMDIEDQLVAMDIEDLLVAMDIEDLMVAMDIEDLLVDMENDCKVLVATENQLSIDLLMINQ
jgi:hypothetical protein